MTSAQLTGTALVCNRDLIFQGTALILVSHLCFLLTLIIRFLFWCGARTLDQMGLERACFRVKSACSKLRKVGTDVITRCYLP